MIIRTEKMGNYTILPNAFLLDDTISDKARGTLARLLCRPDNWSLNINHLVKTGKGGQTAVRSAIKELENAGYIQKEVTRHENGRIIGVEYLIHESPVKSCVDRPAPDPSCKETEPKEVQANDDQTREADIKDISIEKGHMRKTVIKEIAPIINTDIKQILRETTTTPEPEPVISDQLLPSSYPTNDIINLIPEKHQTPVVLSLVNKAVVDYPEREVKEAVAYAAGNVRGGSMQFKAYLDKALKNKWAEGYLDTVGNDPFAVDVFGAGQFTNGFTTGSKRMDRNLAACLEFVAYAKRKEATA